MPLAPLSLNLPNERFIEYTKPDGEEGAEGGEEEAAPPASELIATDDAFSRLLALFTQPSTRAMAIGVSAGTITLLLLLALLLCRSRRPRRQPSAPGARASPPRPAGAKTARRQQAQRGGRRRTAHE